ncbi:MAG TPA: aminotransferase class III-fold pyridoxal phosphate-dependent enzyme, partial [Gemmatimonadaceae bacterium]|nr:aminotransferase class III-fold pyridoxal phosphate-dependent enzyme [Gemmatimonadaceae bacterium]
MIWDKFRRSRGDEKPATAPELDDTVERDDVEEAEPEGGAEEVTHEPWRDRAVAVIPGGSSTGSKRVEALYGDAPLDDSIPTHYSRARGCSLFLVDGDSELEVVDCTMALGSVAIGYADAHVLAAAGQAMGLGNVAGVPHTLEVSLAERLCDFIPCAEQVRFLKSGAEAVSAAVRIARTYTGRDLVVCAGYFGWHDWASGEEVAGVPRGARTDVVRVPFDDVAALEHAVRDAGNRLAAIAIEPVVERMPSARWIARARALATEANAVLIFDEMKTGFRLKPGGYGELAAVEPDLAVFGKALANGFPLAAVVGRAEVMDAARRTWISSTLAG